MLCRELNFVEQKRQKVNHVGKCSVCQICGNVINTGEVCIIIYNPTFQHFPAIVGKSISMRKISAHNQRRCFKKDFSFICRQFNERFRAVQDLNSHVDAKHSQNGGRVPITPNDISLPDQPSTSMKHGENKNP